MKTARRQKRARVNSEDWVVFFRIIKRKNGLYFYLISFCVYPQIFKNYMEKQFTFLFDIFLCPFANFQKLYGKTVYIFI